MVERGGEYMAGVVYRDKMTLDIIRGEILKWLVNGRRPFNTGSVIPVGSLQGRQIYAKRVKKDPVSRLPN